MGKIIVLRILKRLFYKNFLYLGFFRIFWVYEDVFIGLKIIIFRMYVNKVLGMEFCVVVGDCGRCGFFEKRVFYILRVGEFWRLFFGWVGVRIRVWLIIELVFGSVEKLWIGMLWFLFCLVCNNLNIVEECWFGWGEVVVVEV